MIRSAADRLLVTAQKWAVVTALSLVFFGTALSAITGLAIEEMSDVDPTPFVAIIGVVTGVGTMIFVRKADGRTR